MKPKVKTNVKITSVVRNLYLITTEVTEAGKKLIKRDFSEFGSVYIDCPLHNHADIYVYKTHDLDEVVEYLKEKTKELDELTL